MTESNKPTEAEQSADLQFTISLSPETYFEDATKAVKRRKALLGILESLSAMHVQKEA